MGKHIVVLMGSPRKNGNTDMLADAFIKGAEMSGNQVEKFYLGDMKVNGCLDCKYCVAHDGACSQKDDMQKIYPALYKADMVVFASPVYFFGLSAQIKAVIDRFYTIIGKPFPIQSCVLLMPYGDTPTAVVAPSIAFYEAICNYLEWENKGIITVPGIEVKGAIIGHPSLEEAEILGRSIS